MHRRNVPVSTCFDGRMVPTIVGSGMETSGVSSEEWCRAARDSTRPPPYPSVGGTRWPLSFSRPCRCKVNRMMLDLGGDDACASEDQLREVLRTCGCPLRSRQNKNLKRCMVVLRWTGSAGAWHPADEWARASLMLPFGFLHGRCGYRDGCEFQQSRS